MLVGEEMDLKTFILVKILYYLPVIFLLAMLAVIAWGKGITNLLRWVFKIKK